MAEKLALIDLDSQAAWEFQFFPNEVRTADRANWEPQDTTIGTKPLFYANREPRRISFPELYLDYSGESLTATLDELRVFAIDEKDTTGMPARLLATWGDRIERCVMEELSIEEIFFNSVGEPTRARIGIELIELQPDGEGTSVREPVYNENIDPGGG